MDKFFEWISNNSFAAAILIASFGVLIFSIVLIYLIAFFQGREISFWPPKIGNKPLGKKNTEPTENPDNKNEHNIISQSDENENIYILKKTGIERVYTNLTDCKNDMVLDFQRATEIRLLLQIGRRELGDGVSSMFFPLSKQKNQPGTRLRVLRAANKTPFLSKTRAERRGRTTYDEWQGELNRLHGIILRLKNIYHVNVEEREHLEPYLWRIFIFDNTAYVSGYLYGSGNDNTAVVYKIKEGENSIYAIFDKYFEYLWKKYEPNTDPESDKHWVNWE
ncbi:MAG: hypothetical protein HOP27_04775 [Anaerolineales bacterium]|nr:hypothetical protein [Anaerolineales bacterium]